MIEAKFKSERSQQLFDRILYSLRDKPQATDTLTRTLSLSDTHVRAALVHLKEQDRVHVVGWCRNRPSHRPVPIWAVGAGKDVPLTPLKDKPRTPKSKSPYVLIGGRRVARDYLVAALFGPPQQPA